MSMWDWDEQGDTEPPRDRQYRDPYASHSGSSDYHGGYGGHQSQSDHSHHQHSHEGHAHLQHHHGHAESDNAHSHHRHGASPSRQNYGGRHESYEDQGHEHDTYGSQSHERHDSYEHHAHRSPTHASNMARAPAVHSANYGGHQGYGEGAGYESQQEHHAPAPPSARGHEATRRADLFTSDSVVNLTLDEIDALARTHRSRSWLVVLYAPWCRFCQVMEANFERVARHLERTDVYVGRFRADGDYKEYAKQYLQLEHFPTVLFFPKDSSNIVKYNSENREVDALLGFVQSF